MTDRLNIYRKAADIVYDCYKLVGLAKRRWSAFTG